MKELLSIIEEMKGNKISNYIIAGLDSTAITGGMVRLF